MPRRVKVAVIGSGLAGLTASYLLAQKNEADSDADVEFDVHLFEKAPEIGMDSASISVPVPGEKWPNAKPWRIDVPMRSFQGGYYPNLIKLYEKLGVSFRVSDFSYSFSTLIPETKKQPRRIEATMIYNGASGRSGLGMTASMEAAYTLSKTQGRHAVIRACARLWSIVLFLLSSLQIVLCFARMLWLAAPWTRSQKGAEMTFREWAEYTRPTSILAKLVGWDGVWRNYTYEILVPLFSAVCTAPESDIWNHPMEEFMDYMWLTFGTHHYVVNNGVQDVVTRLSSGLEHVHTSSTISKLTAEGETTTIHYDTPNESLSASGFHHVIFATQATRAAPLLTSYLDSLPEDAPQRPIIAEQIACLQAFQYRLTIVTNHTDSTLLPNSLTDQRELNLMVMKPSTSPSYPHLTQSQIWNSDVISPTYTMATHILHRPVGYPEDAPQIYQTTNPLVAPEKSKVLSQVKLERAIVSPESKEALKGLFVEERHGWLPVCAGQGTGMLGRLQGAGRLDQEKGKGPGIWICGSFAYAGIPLLEGCVVSARNVVQKGVWESEGIRDGRELW